MAGAVATPTVLVLVAYSDAHEAARISSCLTSADAAEVITCPLSRLGSALIDDANPSLIFVEAPAESTTVIESCEMVRDMTDRPVAVLTKTADSLTVTRAFDTGVDEFLSLPMDDAELVARVGALARRWRRSEPSNNLSFGDLLLRPDEQQVEHGGHSVSLTPMEYRLLACLVAAQGHVVTHDYLMANVWGAEYVDSRHYLHLYIRYLRDKLEVDPKKPEIIISEWGIGYRLQHV